MKFGKSLFVAAVLAVTLFGSYTAQGFDEEEKAGWVMRPIEKLSRGIANVAFGPLEIPIRWMEVKNDMGGIAGITYGSLRGVAFTIAREVVGLVDILTFPFPLPNCPEYPDDAGWGYGPMMRPAWVIGVENDWGNFVYDRETIVRESY